MNIKIKKKLAGTPKRYKVEIKSAGHTVFAEMFAIGILGAENRGVKVTGKSLLK